MPTLEEMQELNDAMETVDKYNGQWWVKSLILIVKTISWVFIGILFEVGRLLAKMWWGN
jgi:hypothetical protein